MFAMLANVQTNALALFEGLANERTNVLTMFASMANVASAYLPKYTQARMIRYVILSTKNIFNLYEAV
jgi:hypothetical protein